MKFILKLFKITIILIITAQNLHANEIRYFVCGPDEDGCYPDIYQYCLCIPVDEKTKLQAYCLNFDDLSCIPLSDAPNCKDIFKNQAECLATAFQSETNPPCPIHKESFCISNHIALCLADSGIENCK